MRRPSSIPLGVSRTRARLRAVTQAHAETWAMHDAAVAKNSSDRGIQTADGAVPRVARMVYPYPGSLRKPHRGIRGG
jgi:hypothetical protein